MVAVSRCMPDLAAHTVASGTARGDSHVRAQPLSVQGVVSIVVSFAEVRRCPAPFVPSSVPW
jgi:hypothetical protein